MRPKHVPVVAVRRDKSIDLEEESNQFWLTFEHLVVDGGLANLRVCIRAAAGCRRVLLGKVGLVADQGIDPFNQILITLGHLLYVTPSIVPGDVLDVEDLEEFKSHEAIVSMLVFLSDCVSNEWLNFLNILLVYQLYSSLVSHRTWAHLIPGRWLCWKIALASLATIIEMRATIFVRAQ